MIDVSDVLVLAVIVFGAAISIIGLQYLLKEIIALMTLHTRFSPAGAFLVLLWVSILSVSVLSRRIL